MKTRTRTTASKRRETQEKRRVRVGGTKPTDPQTRTKRTRRTPPHAQEHKGATFAHCTARRPQARARMWTQGRKGNRRREHAAKKTHAEVHTEAQTHGATHS
ncbi:hypothetical protein, conserved in T. vivax, partial [Trypanosoma vivax Y486]